MTAKEKKQQRFMNMMELERDRQDRLHPGGLCDNGKPSRTLSLTVLAAEVGEFADAILEHDRDNQTTELVQVAAVCMRIYEEVL